MAAARKKETGRRERRKEQTRTALLDAAMALFSKHGLYGTRIADITERADVGKGVFYNYYSTKEAVIAELVRRGLEALEQEFASVKKEKSLARRVEQLANLHESFFRKSPQYALLIHQARGLLQLGGENCEPLREVFRAYLIQLSQWLPPPGATRGWSDDDLVDAAATLAGAVAGYRSFKEAAGLPTQRATVGKALSQGIPHLMKRRR